MLAQKEGSSSDTGVLELTAATASAAAGAHSVVVNSLAQTSSGYMAEIANSADTLTGSVTINGTVIDVPAATTGNNTLSGLASAINASGLSVTANVLTDASGSRLSLVSEVSGASGNITVTANSIVDTSASNTLAATVTAGTGTGSSATTSTALLTAVASATETLSSTGTLSVTVGSGGSQQSIP